MSTLLAGPWVGEFGFELLYFAPAIRAKARDFDHTVVAAPASSQYLYDDFCNFFVPLKTKGHAQHQGRLLEGPDERTLKAIFQYDCQLTGADVIHNRKTMKREHKALGDAPLDYVDVVCFFRPPKTIRSGKGGDMRKAYEPERCKALVGMLLEKGLRVACGGTKSDWYYPPAIDLRGIELERLCNILKGAQCAVGPSSGTMHLSMLCSCPVVTWYIAPYSKKRYMTPSEWNPFSTPATFIDGGGQPEPSVVCKAVLEHIVKET